MRVAIILAMLARSIDTHLFHPTYVLEEDSGVRQLLLRQAVRNSKRESFCRALLLSMFPEEQEVAAGERVNRVIEDMRNVEDLLPQAKIEDFRSELGQFVRRTCKTWVTVQRIRERFEPSFELTRVKDLEWQALLFEASAASEKEPTTAIQGGRDDELLVVFPRLYVVEKDQEPEPVTAGTVLKRSQSLAAAQELEEQPLSPTFGTATSPRSRRVKPRNLSISVHGNGSPESQTFLEQKGGSKGK
jgi:hypothetical protein